MCATVIDDATAASPGSAPPGILNERSGDQRIIFRRVDWHTYDQLSRSRGEGQHARLIYDGRDLEIVVTGHFQEILKGLVARIVNALAMGLNIDCLGSGQATWKTQLRGLEAGLSYYFDAEKIRTAMEAFARQSMDAADYPHPDMAIEIDMSPPQVDRPSIYRELRVAEVWRFVRRDKFVIEQLQADGTYAEATESRFLRVGPEDVCRWVSEAEANRPRRGIVGCISGQLSSATVSGE